MITKHAVPKKAAGWPSDPWILSSKFERRLFSYLTPNLTETSPDRPILPQAEPLVICCPRLTDTYPHLTFALLLSEIGGLPTEHIRRRPFNLKFSYSAARRAQRHATCCVGQGSPPRRDTPCFSRFQLCVVLSTCLVLDFDSTPYRSPRRSV